METKLLFQTDAYCREFKSVVEETDPQRNGITLSETVFYPGGGGQPADFGIIQDKDRIVKVTGFDKSQGNQWHIIDGILPIKGSEVWGTIDWERRYQLMRTHTAMHILCGVIWRDFKAMVTGGNMEPLQGRMDFEFENMTSNLVGEIENKINAEIKQARDIKVAILPREEAERIPDLIRTKINLLPKDLKFIRTVEIKGLDLQADGGTHVNNTREVGQIIIFDYQSKGKINKRLKIRITDP